MWCSVFLSGPHGGALGLPYCLSISYYPSKEKNKVDLLYLPTPESAIDAFVEGF
jgi:hypothetical protein